jgi:hypothetical protein
MRPDPSICANSPSAAAVFSAIVAVLLNLQGGTLDNESHDPDTRTDGTRARNPRHDA